MLHRLERQIVRLEKKSTRFSHLRLVLFLVGAAMALVVWRVAGVNAALGAGAIGLVAFFVVAVIHERIVDAMRRLALWRTIKQRHLARLKLDWDALPDPPKPASLEHPYAADLDVAGPRSLLHILDTSATRVGQDCLRAWMLETPGYERIPERQAAVRALVPERRFRDRLTLHGLEHAGDDARWDLSPVLKWLDPSLRTPSWNKKSFLIVALWVINLVLIGVNIAGGPSWWLYSMSLYWFIYAPVFLRLASRAELLLKLNKSLKGLIRTMRWIEAYRPRLSPTLNPLWEPLTGSGSPSLFLKRMKRIDLALAGFENNLLHFLLNIVGPYDLAVMILLDNYLDQLEPVAGAWIDRYGEIEALSALATYADFRPESCTFPTLNVASPSAFIEGEAVAHPLLSEEVRISNDLDMHKGQVAVITGSNMSGKSTYLRAAGMATLMAWAGGPVCARRLSLSPLRPYTSMRIGDVLQDGKSTFYAEVLRLSSVMQAVGDTTKAPVFVLLDEILRGTNTRERLIGVTSIVRALAGGSALSMIATHDQEVTHLAAESDDVLNFHFKERIEDSRLLFEYRMHPGPSDTTNALIIMQRAGLPVTQPTPGTG